MAIWLTTLMSPSNLAEKKIIPHCSFVQRFPDCSVKTCLSPWGWLNHLSSSALLHQILCHTVEKASPRATLKIQAPLSVSYFGCKTHAKHPLRQLSSATPHHHNVHFPLACPFPAALLCQGLQRVERDLPSSFCCHTGFQSGTACISSVPVTMTNDWLAYRQHHFDNPVF